MWNLVWLSFIVFVYEDIVLESQCYLSSVIVHNFFFSRLELFFCFVSCNFVFISSLFLVFTFKNSSVFLLRLCFVDYSCYECFLSVFLLFLFFEFVLTSLFFFFGSGICFNLLSISFSFFTWETWKLRSIGQKKKKKDVVNRWVCNYLTLMARQQRWRENHFQKRN